MRMVRLSTIIAIAVFGGCAQSRETPAAGMLTAPDHARQNHVQPTAKPKAQPPLGSIGPWPQGFALDGHVTEWTDAPTATIQISGRSSRIWLALDRKGLVIAAEIDDGEGEHSDDRLQVLVGMPEPQRPLITKRLRGSVARVEISSEQDCDYDYDGPTPSSERQCCHRQYAETTEALDKFQSTFRSWYTLTPETIVQTGTALGAERAVPNARLAWTRGRTGRSVEAHVPSASLPLSAQAPVTGMRIAVHLIQTRDGKVHVTSNPAESSPHPETTSTALPLLVAGSFGANPSLLTCIGRRMPPGLQYYYQPADDVGVLRSLGAISVDCEVPADLSRPLGHPISLTSRSTLRRVGSVQADLIGDRSDPDGRIVVSMRQGECLDAVFLSKERDEILTTFEREGGIDLIRSSIGPSGAGACGCCGNPNMVMSVIRIGRDGRFLSPPEGDSGAFLELVNMGGCDVGDIWPFLENDSSFGCRGNLTEGTTGIGTQRNPRTLGFQRRFHWDSKRRTYVEKSSEGLPTFPDSWSTPP